MAGKKRQPTPLCLMPRPSITMSLPDLARELRDQVDRLSFPAPVACVYNPLAYAWKPHQAYLERFGQGPKRVVFLGMNPGPWGMAQSGVPFGEIHAVKSWMGIEEPVQKPTKEHPKRPIEGFACAKSEVSGRRLWGLFSEKFPRPDDFFHHHFVANYCPLVFMSETGANITPDKLPAAAAEPLHRACDEHLAGLLRHLQPEWAHRRGGLCRRANQGSRDGSAAPQNRPDFTSQPGQSRCQPGLGGHRHGPTQSHGSLVRFGKPSSNRNPRAGCGTESNSESNWSGSFMSPLRNAFARAPIKIFPLPLPQPHAESVVNDHGYSLEISPRPTSQLKFKSHAVARFREPGSSSRFCPRARCITPNQVSQEVQACRADLRNNQRTGPHHFSKAERAYEIHD
jgi:single-strand selective monofunctional uracil DNA glycosylase